MKGVIRMREWLYASIIAFQFLTRLPLPVKVDYTTLHVSRSLVFYPLVGWGLGLLQLLYLTVFASSFSPIDAAILMIIALIYTGGLHMDGWMDTADALGSHRSRERMLEIMKDSRVGAMGVLAAVALVLLKWTSIWALIQYGAGQAGLFLNLPVLWLIVPVVSRWWMGVAIHGWPYVGGESGLGSYYAQKRKQHLLPMTLIALFPICFISSPVWVLVPLLQMAAGFAFTRYVSQKLGGCTGDTYGAMQELTEATGYLAGAYILMKGAGAL
jgi:adenosylcobinamide-GDP ribazoletransferase